MRREVAVCVGWVVVVLGGLALISGCQSPGDGPAIEAPSETEAPSVVAPVTAEPEQDKDFKLALVFVPEQTTTYKVTTQMDRSIKWEGSTAKKPDAFKGGNTGNTVEMTFAQQVERLKDDGQAILKITIESLKYQGVSHGKVVLDFDSTRDSDQDSPMAKLIGQSYKLEMTAKGEVIALIDMEPVRRVTEGVTPAHRTAERLLSDKVVRKRHEVASLTALEPDTVPLQAHWSKEAGFVFGMFGAKAYERVYTFDRVEQGDETNDAVIVMKAIPSISGVGAAHQGQAVNPLMGMFDSTDRYEGELRLDLGAGQIRAYSEHLQTQWVTADPAAIQSGDTNPAVLRMGAVESYRLERVE